MAETDSITIFNNMRLTILTFLDHYLPGYRGGGPTRSIAGLVNSLGGEFDFKIITLDRDFGSNRRYQGIKVNNWQRVGKAKVFYLSPDNIKFTFLRRIVNCTPHNILYLNSFFSPSFTIKPMILRRLGLFPKAVTIVAPRGQFSLGALNLKPSKKRVFIKIAQILSLYQNVVWNVSNANEKQDLIRAYHNSLGIHRERAIVIAQELADIKNFEINNGAPKQAGSLKVAFLSRVSPMKNLDSAIKMLTNLRGKITFNIFGPLEDKTYWKNCRKVIEKLPANIQVHYQGIVDHDEVFRVLAMHDLFFLPTRGENFGHVIIEALSAGCPILISDQTPWRNLEKEGVGADLPLDRPERFTEVLQQFTDMDQRELSPYSQRARDYGRKKASDPEIIIQNRDLFLNSIKGIITNV